MSRVPTEQEIRQYLTNKQVSELFVSLLEGICIDRPHDVPSYLVDYLEKNFTIRRGKSVVKKATLPKTHVKKRTSGEGLFTPAYTFGKKNEDDDEEEEVVDENYEEQRTTESEDDDDEDHSPTRSSSVFDIPREDSLEDKESDMIRRRYSVSVPRRAGISNESLKVDTAVNFPVIPKTEQERVRLQAALDACPVFKHLDKDEKKVVFDAMAEKSFTKGEIIIKQGDEGSLFYVVDSGQCDVYVNDSHIKTYNDGDSFGELALIYGTPRAATIIAKSDNVKLWAIDRITFRTVLMGQTINRRKLYEEFLKNVEILKTLNDYERLTIADALQAETWHSGDVIVTQGETGHSFYIIVEGNVLVKKDGAEVARLKSGQYFGEMALMFNQPRAATVIAIDDVKTVRLDRKSFKLLLGPCEEILKRNTNIYNQFISKQI